MSDTGITFLVLGGVIAFFGLLVLLIIFLKKKLPGLQIKKDEEISEEEAVKQELDRVLVPIEDEDTLKQMEEKKDNE